MPLSYAALTPDVVLDACDSAGFRADGRLAPLNSYENRVYQVWLEDGASVVLKFYRPGRWSARQIAEEHAFAKELAEHEIPVVAPSFAGEHAGFRFAVYPRRGGRSPELEDRKTLEWIGRFIGRIHAVGASRQFKNRESLTAESFGREPRAWLLEHALIPADLLDAWKTVAEQALASVARCYERAGEVRSIRLHGDCHAGNILWTESGPHFVDLDDARRSPESSIQRSCSAGPMRASSRSTKCGPLSVHRMFPAWQSPCSRIDRTSPARLLRLATAASSCS